MEIHESLEKEKYNPSQMSSSVYGLDNVSLNKGKDNLFLKKNSSLTYCIVKRFIDIESSMWMYVYL